MATVRPLVLFGAGHTLHRTAEHCTEMNIQVYSIAEPILAEYKTVQYPAAGNSAVQHTFVGAGKGGLAIWGGGGLLTCCSLVDPPSTALYYEGGLRFSSMSPGKEPGGPWGLVHEGGGITPPGPPSTESEGSSRGGPGWPMPAGSYWEFSRREISRSSSSPNSPPIRDGSPTTITSWGVGGQGWRGAREVFSSYEPD